MRVSNFFLWQLAYTEIYVTDTLWPDFREREFQRGARRSSSSAQRRFGTHAGAGRARGRAPCRDELRRAAARPC